MGVVRSFAGPWAKGWKGVDPGSFGLHRRITLVFMGSYEKVLMVPLILLACGVGLVDGEGDKTFCFAIM